MTRTSGSPHQSRRQKSVSPLGIGVAVITVGLMIMIIGQIMTHGWTFVGLVNDLYANLGSELVGIAVVILVVERLGRRHDETRLRRQLIREMSSSDNGLVARSVLELEGQGWLYDGTLEGASLSGSNLQGICLERVRLSMADLAGANLQHVDLSRAVLVSCNFSGSLLNRANLEMSDMSACILQDAQLQRADMAYAKLCGANLAGALLSEADLTGADMTGANLIGANLVNATLDKAILADVRHDDTTLWPEDHRLPD
ncbi:pentapeptide repeat-containing protein [Nonomuraea sp. NPDC001684]